jgi:hypothetical protein
MNLLRTAAAILALGCSLRPALADGTPTANALATDSANPGGQVLPKNTSAIQAAVNTDEKTATITGTFNLNPKTSEPENDYISVTVQTPLAQGQNYTNTATLDGLTKSTAVSFKYVHKSGGFVSESQEDALRTEAAQDACWAVYTEAMREVPARSRSSAVPGRPQKKCNEGFAQDAQAKRIAQDNAYSATPDASDDQIALNKEIEKSIAKELADLNEILLPKPADLWVWSLSGKVGYEQHMYYDPTTLVKDTANKTPWQVGASIGFVPEKVNASFNLSFNYQESFLDSDFGMTQTKCINSGATCVNGFIGAPTLHDKALISGDIRWIGKLPGLDIPIGIDPGFTYDAIQDAEAVQFPIYLVSDANNQLTGGIRYDWTSTTHVSTVGLFVSTAFSISE